ncbi:hypothetical protein ADIARSV_2676 [Arcticibacter svalbardensis MN12-7]|uniref:Uncharacterized protein n=1 Tax=Arcticibacter svalbardensis MN12-7 TaxID=1150600 RepID=R9GR55_9SPHI|nr:hypothetical protein [Arcticibacter svalbardensis]EOR94181.1 hypothetical protein ADIARSV_2676 [Arcticibacter svalbardensis MN12-7]
MNNGISKWLTQGQTITAAQGQVKVITVNGQPAKWINISSSAGKPLIELSVKALHSKARTSTARNFVCKIIPILIYLSQFV